MREAQGIPGGRLAGRDVVASPRPRRAPIVLVVNRRSVDVDVDPTTPLLWVLRESLGLTGTKYGCGVGLCGSCTVHLDGEPARSCSVAVSEAQGRSITTIEGLRDAGGGAVQDAWVAVSVPQCGYCQAGQIMTAAALVGRAAEPTDGEILEAMAGNVCRCGTYRRILEAIRLAARGGGGA